jgi:hypothetical protein
VAVVACGGSVAHGFGGYASYGRQLAAALGVDFIDHTLPHSYVARSLESLKAAPANTGDVVLVQHGLAEGLWRPKGGVWRALPDTWQQQGGLDPSPHRSRSIARRFRQVLRNGVKAAYKWGLLLCGRCEQAVSREEYARDLRALLATALQDVGSTGLVVVLGPTRIPPYYFPGASRSFRQYWKVTRSVAQEMDVMTVAVRPLLRRVHYSQDGLHPNQAGHDLIAAELMQLMPSRLRGGGG